jgi:hypothetical protein
MKALLLIVIAMMTISGCKVSYQKSHVTEGDIVTSAGITLNAKVCLEGAFDNNTLGLEMVSTLNVIDLIPTETPYFIFPWWHTSFNDYSLSDYPIILDPDLDPLTTFDRVYVDWVLVQVFKDINGTMTFMDSQSGILHYDGTIYDSSGLPGIVFPELAAGNYYINIIHRNHLSIASENSVALNSDFDQNVYNIDFTLAGTPYLDEGSLIPPPFIMKDVTTKCLKAGDLDGNLKIEAADQTVMSNNIAAVVAVPRGDTAILGYMNSDLNFDGQTQMYIDHPGTDQTLTDLEFITDNIGDGALHGY